MAKKTKALSPITRQKISLSKTKYKKADLIEGGLKYINEVLNADPKEKKLPSVVGLCLSIGISRSRMYELADQHQEVSDILEYVSMLQEDRALQGGITNRLNPVFSMFLLKGKHGYQDQPPTLNQTNNFGNLTPDLLADALKIIREEKK